MPSDVTKSPGMLLDTDLEINVFKSVIYGHYGTSKNLELVEVAGIEPASASSLLLALHA